MRLRSALLAATVLAVPVAVKAQPVTGLYIGAGGGANFLTDEYQKRNNSLGTAGRTYDFKPGYTGQASVGFGLGNLLPVPGGLRVELEGLYASNNVRSAHGTAAPTKAGGEQQAYAGFGNILYDFDFGLPFYPYVGGGVGYADTRVKNIHTYNANGAVFTTNDNGWHGSPAADAKLGVSVPIPAVPGLSLTAEYQFTDAWESQHFPVTVNSAGKITSGRATITSDYNHAAIFGVRYAFGALPILPTMAQPPAPVPPQVSRTYLVFFDWDKYNLTDRARQIVAEAAAASTKTTYTRIEVNGYTDLSGTAQYNQGLSVRRAQTVAAELVRLGVPKTAIDIRGFGETHPLVPTAKGVREPQNRRVEIIIK